MNASQKHYETEMTQPANHESFFTDVEIARMLGKNPVTVRKWRTRNTKVGCIKYGPPYEYHGPNVVYPKDKFSAWCTQVKMIGGVPHMNAPIDANIPLPQAEVANAA